MLRPPLASAKACSATGSLLAALWIANTGTAKPGRQGAPYVDRPSLNHSASSEIPSWRTAPRLLAPS
jgi:hypothetical protein